MAVAKQILTHADYQIKFEEIQIVASYSSYYYRVFREVMEIYEHKNNSKKKRRNHSAQNLDTDIRKKQQDMLKICWPPVRDNSRPTVRYISLYFEKNYQTLTKLLWLRFINCSENIKPDNFPMMSSTCVVEKSRINLIRQQPNHNPKHKSQLRVI